MQVHAWLDLCDGGAPYSSSLAFSLVQMQLSVLLNVSDAMHACLPLCMKDLSEWL